MRLLIAFGCNAYDHMPRLSGAEEDAQRIWRALQAPGLGQYDGTASKLSLSPNLSDFRRALEGLPTDGSVDVLTVYFGGHGGAKAGNYYLCPIDAHPSKLATTAFPFVQLLAVISEVGPRQANLIIDACQAAGGMYDFASILNREALEEGASMGISVLAACGSRQFAYESNEGGAATTALCRYLEGTRILQAATPFLDLLGTGQAVSEDVRQGQLQTPVIWGVNVTGMAQFATNPHYIGHADSLTERILPSPVRQQVIDRYGDDLAQLHRDVADEVLPHRVVDALGRVASYVEEQGQSGVNFLEGITASLAVAAADSGDLLAGTAVVDSAIAVALCLRDSAQVDFGLRTLLEQRCTIASGTISTLEALSAADGPGLINKRHVVSDLFQLPIRLCGIMGWIGAHLLVSRTLGRSLNDLSGSLEKIATNLFDRYGGAFVAMADEQGPPVHAFVHACRSVGLNYLAEQLLGCLYADLIATAGCVARLRLDGRKILQYLLIRSMDAKQVPYRYRANPSNLITSIVTLAAELQLDDLYDYDLKTLDHKTCNVFVPSTYADFGYLRIHNGVNHTFNIGYGVWTLEDVRKGLNERSPAIRAALNGISAERLAGAILVSQALPDRVAGFLDLPTEATPAESDPI